MREELEHHKDFMPVTDKATDKLFDFTKRKLSFSLCNSEEVRSKLALVSLILLMERNILKILSQDGIFFNKFPIKYVRNRFSKNISRH